MLAQLATIVAVSSLALVQATNAIKPKTHCAYDPAIGAWTFDPYLSADLPHAMGVSSPYTLPNAPNFPTAFNGMWWFNNTEPTGLVSITGSDVVQVSELEFKFPAFFHGYGYDNSNDGLASVLETFYQNFYVHLVFSDSTYKFARIYQNFYGIRTPSFVDNFDMYQQDDNTWVRNSTLLNFDVSAGDYIVRRVVNADGTVLPMFNEWLAFNKARTGSDYTLLGNKRDGATWRKMCL